MSGFLVEITDALFGYQRRPVVRAARLTVRAGHCLGIYGPNGSGKTTVLRGIMGLLPALQGRAARQVQARTSYLPQHRELELHWPMSGFDAAAMFASARGRFGRIGPADREALLARMRLLDVESLAAKTFARLSGGQQQRLLLAGLLATAPNLLVLDEPTDGLDAASIDNLISHLRRVRDAGDAGIVMVSHDVDDLLALCDQIALIHPGRAPGDPTDVEIVTREAFPQRLLHRAEAVR